MRGAIIHTQARSSVRTVGMRSLKCLTRLLPVRMLDAQLAKLLGLTKPQPASNDGFSLLMKRGTE
jgi:hypothetical protein